MLYIIYVCMYVCMYVCVYFVKSCSDKKLVYFAERELILVGSRPGRRIKHQCNSVTVKDIYVTDSF